MGNLFELTDPQGRKVACSWEVWNIHIVGRRKWMMKRFEEVQKTVQMPNLIQQDVVRNNRESYYRLFKVGNDSLYMKVVVEFDQLFKQGSVITAYTCDQPKPGETVLWMEI